MANKDDYRRTPRHRDVGNHGARIYNGGIRRDTLVRELRSEWRCFGQTKLGAPKHPLYLPKETPLQTFLL